MALTRKQAEQVAELAAAKFEPIVRAYEARIRRLEAENAALRAAVGKTMEVPE